MGVLEFPILIIKKFNEIYFFAINCACLDENPLRPKHQATSDNWVTVASLPPFRAIKDHH